MRFRPAMDATTGELYLPVEERGRQLLEEPLLNKGTAFTPEERDALGLRGLLPAHTSTMDEQLARVRTQWDAKPSAMERHIYLESLHDRNETLYHRFILENLQDAVPVVYTPTVAEACRHWSRIHRHARGIYVTPGDRGQIARLLRCRGIRDAAVVVVTDNERILGIGDQGCGGMGIPIGKLALYSVGAGIHPSLCLPVSLDVGTNNEDLLKDPLYLGWREPRLRGDAYWSLVDEFVMAVKEVFPQALLQWEDFANITSFRLMDSYRDVITSFNDDIEGTAAMVVGGLLAASRRLGGGLKDRVYRHLRRGLRRHRHLPAAGQRDADARASRPKRPAARIFVVDLPGLLVEGDKGLDPRMAALATKREVVKGWHVRGDRITLEQVVEHARPTVLIGVCGRLVPVHRAPDPGDGGLRRVARSSCRCPTPPPTPRRSPPTSSPGPGAGPWWPPGSPFGDVTHDGPAAPCRARPTTCSSSPAWAWE